MEIIKAEMGRADIYGKVHSQAWKQAYTDIFPKEYLCLDTPDIRKKEFWESCNSEDNDNYLLYEGGNAIGIVRVINSASDACELSSFYILEEYRNNGYGTQVLEHLRAVHGNEKIQLWVLEDNIKARRFYQNNGFNSTGNTRRIFRGNDYTQIQYELLPEVWAYEMYYDKQKQENPEICCAQFAEVYFEEYKKIYNECFYEMRKALGIEPYNWYSEYEQMADKAENIFIFLKDNQMIGSVACYGNEIDDLIVKKSYQKRGYGKQLLLWAMSNIRQDNNSEITLHVAEWNEGALGLYKKVGFLVRKKEKVR